MFTYCFFRVCCVSITLRHSKKTQNTTTASSGNTIILFPYYKAWSGVTFHVQSAWTDSKSNRLSLTQARSFTVPPAPTQIIRKRMVYNYRPNNSVGSGPVSTFAAQGLARVSYR